MGGVDFEVGDNDYDAQTEDGLTVMEMRTAIDGRPVIATIKFMEPMDILGWFYHLGKPESLESLRESLQLTYEEKAFHDQLGGLDERSAEEILGDEDD